MKKILTLASFCAVLCISLLGCGGGGGSGTSGTGGGGTYPITENRFKNYSGGEKLVYDYSFSAAYNDGSGAVNSSGTESHDIYSGWINPYINYPLLKLVITDKPVSGVSITIEEFYFYDNNNNLVRWLTNTNKYSNIENPLAGSKLIPQNLYTGYGWTNTTYLKQLLGEDYSCTVNYTIISKEYVSVPMGNVEAFKITYSGKTSNNDLTYNGELYVHPSIGIVKMIETGVRFKYYTHYKYNSSISLRSINWSP